MTFLSRFSDTVYSLMRLAKNSAAAACWQGILALLR